MKKLIISVTYDEDQISFDDIRDNMVEFITSTPAYIIARFHKDD